MDKVRATVGSITDRLAKMVEVLKNSCVKNFSSGGSGRKKRFGGQRYIPTCDETTCQTHIGITSLDVWTSLFELSLPWHKYAAREVDDRHDELQTEASACEKGT
eukprot:3683023-Pyramimonas_sp.AAC.1